TTTWLRLLAVALTAVFSARHAAAQGPRTWVVDSTGRGDFMDLQPAFDAASDGDTIFVRLGSYSRGITSKGLRVLGERDDWGRGPTADGIEVVGLPAGRAFVLRSMELLGWQATILRLENNAGHVFVGDIQQFPLAVIPDGDATVTGCTSVAFEDCLMRVDLAKGSNVTFTRCAGGPIRLESCTVTFNRCRLSGHHYCYQ